ncbi:class I SAM-dependent methyltransferase [Geobacter argillaceus]|uniref:Methyltransferase family protein n=1 Tax=Geobacter argillaceus TaxID=345631 RepID=A0A562WQH6_9BACT|nr:class I SAM-dependent methyltransferase [Geobacter argillaceus]TWJ32600.1 methyltransferase family protein [Geobacter argillaceus]
MNCRFCGKDDIYRFLDLGTMALANSFLTAKELAAGNEPKYPLDVYFCEQCGLVQIGHVVPPDALFKEYIYFSSTSDLVHRHAAYLARSFQQRFGLTGSSRVVEIASNDGTVLSYFQKTGVKVLGVEPAANIAKVASAAGIETCNDFFHADTAAALLSRYGAADVILARHVFAHVPEIHSFVKGLKALLAPTGAVAIEAPYLIDFVEKNEFDTVYHEHYSYLSVRAMAYLFDLHGMELFDAERVAIHGGSIIYFIGHKGGHAVSETVPQLIRTERDKGLDRPETYAAFATRTEQVRDDILSLLRTLKGEGKRIAAYGAPAKGNTFLNYCGITTDLVEYTVDKSPYKQGYFTPGMHLPVHHPDRLAEDMPDYVLLLAWNFADEIIDQQQAYLAKGGRFIQAIPEVRIL